MGLRSGGDRGAPLRGVLRELDTDRAEVTRELAVEVPARLTAGAASDQELTGACWSPEGTLLQAAHTELLWIDPVRLAVVRRLSHAAFHSVHGAAPWRGGVVVASTGADAVLDLDGDGVLRHEHRLGRARPPGVDLRQLDHDALKPHLVHPNHVQPVGDALWVTRFEDRAAACLVSGRRIPLPEAMPHDGRLRGGLLWFTQVTGRVVAVDPVTLERRVELDLAVLTGEPRMLGWCRGVEVVGSRLFVGFSMLRRTRHREVLRLMVRGIRGQKLPTRVVEVDLDGPRVVGSFELGNAAGGTIYAITAPEALTETPGAGR